MKAIFLIFLLSLVCCKTTFETIKCVAQNEKVINQVITVLDSIKTKDFGNIFQAVFEAFFIVKNEVEKCLNEEEEPILKSSPESPEVPEAPEYNPFKLQECKMKCGDYAYNYECEQECEKLYGDGFGFDPFGILNNE